MKRLLVIALLLSFRAFAEDGTLASLVKQGDAEDRQGHARAALACFRAAETLAPENVPVLLRIAKQYSDLIAETPPEAGAQAVAEKALDYSRRAVDLDPENAKGRLCLAVSYGRLTDFVGNKLKLEYSRLVKEEALKSLKLDPTDDYAWHVLGRWNYSVANIGTMMKAMAAVVYGGVPPASNEEAAKYFRHAIEIAPQRIVHHRELARVYTAMGRKDLAAREWQIVMALPALDREDERNKSDARQALGSTSTGPGRSASR